MALRDWIAWGNDTQPTPEPPNRSKHALRDWLHPDREDLEERAAILEHEAGLTRQEAERQAGI